MLAGFIALRLRSVLGRRTGHERPPEEASRRYTGAGKTPDDDPKEPVRDDYMADVKPELKAAGAIPGGSDYRLVLSPSSPAFDGIEAIRRADHNFTPEQF